MRSRLAESNKACVHNLADELSSYPKKVGRWGLRGCFVSFVDQRMAAVKCSVKCLPRPQSVEVGSRVRSVCDMLLKRQMFMNYAPRSVCVCTCDSKLLAHIEGRHFEDHSIC